MSSGVTAVIKGEEFKETTHEFEPGVYMIGFDKNCHIALPEKERDLQAEHAKLQINNNGVRIYQHDKDSILRVNGEDKSYHCIADGDEIFLGSVEFKFSIQNDNESNEVESLSETLREIELTSNRIFSEVARRIVGQKDVIKIIWATLLSQGHSLLIGVPGLAKTYMVNTFSEVLGLDFNRIQFTPDLMPSDITGSTLIQLDENGHRHFEFNQGPLFTQLLLADEINRTPPKTQAALLEAMQERQVTVGKETMTLPSPFCVIATQNPIEQEGTYPLPEAQKDRFLTCVHLDYPAQDNEIDILLNTVTQQTPDVSGQLTVNELRKFQRTVNKVAVSREMAQYTVDLVRATRPNTPEAPAFVKEMVEYGAGPRAGQAILRLAKANAAMEGRPVVCREDIDESVLTCLRHRILCNYKAKIAKLNEDQIIRKILAAVECKSV